MMDHDVLGSEDDPQRCPIQSKWALAGVDTVVGDMQHNGWTFTRCYSCLNLLSRERHEGQVLCTSCGRVALGRSQNDEFEYRLETGSGLLILTLEYRVRSDF